MQPGNKTTVTGFILLGFSIPSDAQIALFATFLFTYLITVLGNLLIISLIATSSKLHTPMYLFLCNISSVDILTVTVAVPRMLVNILFNWKYIAFNDCIAQVFAMILLGGTEVFLLCAMCYDRYVAICRPLNYTVVMSWRFCYLLITTSWMVGIVYSFILIMQLYQLPFCGNNVIDHFLCEMPLLLKLACTVNLPNETVFIAVAGSAALITFLAIFMSYVYIIQVILKIPSKKGRKKAFSTCSTHLTVVFLFFGSWISTHLKPSTSSRKGQEKVVSLVYTVFAPMLNPIIYSLRNEAVEKAAKNVMY